MTQAPCACGYKAESVDDLTDHLGEVFIPADDIGPGGQAHAEVARHPPATGTLTCRCGFTVSDIAGFDQHLLDVFTPADRIGLDGKRHARIGVATRPS
jgi:hypothetical protein